MTDDIDSADTSTSGDISPTVPDSRSLSITVVLDSTEVTRDWHLQGLTFKLLQYLIETNHIQIAIPASVVEEVIANYERSYDEATRALKRATRLFLRLGVDAPTVPENTLNYRGMFSELIDELHGVSILPWPKVTHKDLVDRAVRRTPPFDAAGSGYRDSLVWASVLELASDENRPTVTSSGYSITYGMRTHVVLASSDRIFSDGSGGLATPLAKEAETRGLSIELARDLQGWITAQLPPSTAALGLRDIAANARDRRLATELASSDFFYLLEIDAQAIGLPRSTGLVGVDDVDDFDIERLRHRRLPNNETLVEYRLEMFLSIEAEMSQEDAEANSWSYDAVTGGRRVSVQIEVAIECDLEAIFDAYDQDFDFEIGKLRRIKPADVVDTGIGAPVEPWNIPLPFEENSLRDAESEADI